MHEPDQEQATSIDFQAQAVPDGGMRRFEQGGRKVLVTRGGNSYAAFDAVCPHAGADLGLGVRCGHRVVCPWHHATFEANSGGLLEPPAVKGLTRYALKREGDQLTVLLDQPLPDSELPVVGGPDDHTIIIGGGASGFMTAQTLRAGGYSGQITLLAAEPQAPYDRTALSKGLLSGKTGPEKLPLGGPDWAQRQRVDLKLGQAVKRLDPNAREAVLEDGTRVAGTQLVVSTGSVPVRLKVPGAELEGVHLLRSMADAEQLKQADSGAHVVIVGSSFIGLEAASSLVGEGGAASVTVIGQEAEVLSRALTPEVGRALRALHETHGVKFILNSEVEAIEGQDRVSSVQLKSGDRLKADLVLLGIGVRPASRLLKEFCDDSEAGKGAVHADEHLRLAPGLYATGDIASAPTVLGEVRVEHWRVAMQHGLVVAGAILAGLGGAPSDSRPAASMRERVPFFWTQQYGRSLRYVGHAQNLDDTHRWGDVPNLKFIEFAFGGGQVVAASGMGYDTDLAAFEELLRLGGAPKPAEVRAGEFSLAARLAEVSAY
jgi:apoptosis-inducing factor 3